MDLSKREGIHPSGTVNNSTQVPTQSTSHNYERFQQSSNAQRFGFERASPSQINGVPSLGFEMSAPPPPPNEGLERQEETKNGPPIIPRKGRPNNQEIAKNEAALKEKQNEAASKEDNTVSTNEDRNQLDQIIVQVSETQTLASTAKVVGKMLLRKHNDVQDFDVSIPELLLKQQQKTKNIFNIVLGAIAGISLIVGGIGIMNIMLASVLERVREIGTRQAIGASRKDIVFQFLSESTLISVSGGLIGIILGIVLSKIIQTVFDIKTIISLFSIIISFSVSVFIGIVFGYVPAKRAAEKDPVESLRQ